MGLVGLVITIALLTLITLGASQFGSTAIGQSIAFTAFALCLIVAAFECRSETDSALTPTTFDSKQMNWVALGEFVLAVMTTQMDVMRRLLDTTELTMRQFSWALVPPVVLLLLWELGKVFLRRGAASTTASTTSTTTSAG